MLRTSLWVVLKDLGTLLREPWHAFSPRGQEVPRIHQAGWGPREAPTAEKSTESPGEVQLKEPPGTILSKAKQARETEQESVGSAETVGLGKENKVEGDVGPRQGLLRTSTALPQRQECFQYWSHPETMSLLTGHSGTLRSPPIPEDH